MKRLLVFSDDWGRHPSSCQHLVGELLDSTEVVWVDTIGTRRPRFDRLTLERGVERLRQWSRARTRVIGGNPRVLRPLMWPSIRSPLARRFNQWSIVRTVRRELQDGRWVAVTTVPIIDLTDSKLPIDRWVYYAVDDIAVWPQLDHSSLEGAERRLLLSVDTVIAASEAIRDRIGQSGQHGVLLTHGVDIEMWRHPGGVLTSLEEFERPLVTFWGVVDQRLDVALVQRLAEQLETGTVLFVGPHNNPDPALFHHDRVRAIGPVPFTVLPRVAHESSVLIMPYADLPVTRAMQPLKLKEYLASGRPVVTTALPAAQAWSTACDVATDAEAFVTSVIKRIAGGVPATQLTNRASLAGETWHAKAVVFLDVLFGSVHDD